VDLICEYFDFTPGVHYYMLNQGYESVPWILQKRFEDAHGEVIRDTWVIGFDKTDLDDGSTGVALHFRGDRPPVTARAIILAMPRRSLELLRREGPVFGPENAKHIQHLLNSVRAVPLYKLFLAYDYPWWNAVGVSQGRSLTDTPVRQVYYWPVGPGAAVPQATDRALLMAYNDATNVDFWAGLSGAKTPIMHDATALQHLRRVPPGAPVYEPQGLLDEEDADRDELGRRLRKNWDEHKAPRSMVMEMHRQLERIHNIQHAPKPIAAAYMDWSVDPHGGGVHLWNPGYKSWEIVNEMTKPVHDFPCYICGEAYSTNQTWVEGALQTAEIVLQRHFGLKKPSWVSPSPK
jgi:monoamine oxidase